MAELKPITITYKQSEEDLWRDATDHSSPAAYYKDLQREHLKSKKQQKQQPSFIIDDFSKNIK